MKYQRQSLCSLTHCSRTQAALGLFQMGGLPPADPTAQQGICPLISAEWAGRQVSTLLMQSEHSHSLLSSTCSQMRPDHLSVSIQPTDGERILQPSVFGRQDRMSGVIGPSLHRVQWMFRSGQPKKNNTEKRGLRALTLPGLCCAEDYRWPILKQVRHLLNFYLKCN